MIRCCWIVGLLLVHSLSPLLMAQTAPATHPSLSTKLEGEELFWKAAPLKLPALKPAAIMVTSKPNLAIDYAVVQVGEHDPTHFLDNNNTEAWAPVLDKSSPTYVLAKEGLVAGGKIYGDRKYALKEVPEALKNLTLLQTRAAHKAVVDARYAIVLTAEKPTWVFVAVDERGLLSYESLGAPGWLKEYSPTGLKIQTDDSRMAVSNAHYHVFARKAGPGKIVLGAPGVEVTYNSMYFAFFGQEE